MARLFQSFTMFKKKSLFFVFLFLVGTVLAWTPPGDINLQNYYDITNGANASFQCVNISGTQQCSWPSGAGNLSWNQSLADTLYAAIRWGYNQTYIGGTYNVSYDALNSTYNKFWYNQSGIYYYHSRK